MSRGGPAALFLCGLYALNQIYNSGGLGPSCWATLDAVYLFLGCLVDCSFSRRLRIDSPAAVGVAMGTGPVGG